MITINSQRVYTEEELTELVKRVFFYYAADKTPTDEQIAFQISDYKKES